MRSGAILLYGIHKMIIGTNQAFMGEEDLLRSRGVEVMHSQMCIQMMAEFIEQHPESWNEDIGVRVVMKGSHHHPWRAVARSLFLQ